MIAERVFPMFLLFSLSETYHRFKCHRYGAFQYMAAMILAMAARCYRGFTTPEMIRTDLYGIALTYSFLTATAVFRLANGSKQSARAIVMFGFPFVIALFGYSKA